MTESLFFFFASLTLLCAIMVVISKNPVYSVIFLILTFFTISAHYILLNAQFLAAVNIIVYAGAIMVLFLFVLMFINTGKNVEGTIKRNVLAKIAGTVAGGLLFTVVVAALKDVTLGHPDPAMYNSQVGMVENLGKVLFTKYMLPFQLVAVLFLVSMVGAVMIGKRETGEQNF
ncbi:NADH-quinone oxidoreductase subunit J [Pontibacter sp. HSC-14F20]|uniref:NADH-quinone oxidoreductase subunit J family protein n=1 Tax=Pontibacter sp. HSC-14F20 TaxID=2864136 RepID=UPI001C739130|nr:NADH-quinone oxidoreductase subunit J [Pontibacter sp. HSC-14F20]MBX0334134.1 NADH-quinone oxidoreductase subunit J [Pontibacter sp. HSC-14F20]